MDLVSRKTQPEVHRIRKMTFAPKLSLNLILVKILERIVFKRNEPFLLLESLNKKPQYRLFFYNTQVNSISHG